MTTRPKPAMPRRLRRTADLTGRRLGRAVLGYLIAMVAIITLSPFRFALKPLHGFTNEWTTSDLLLNIVLFVPLGFIFQLSRPKGAPLELWRTLLFGASFSATIETVQLFEASRYSSLMDVACNTLGGGLGAVIHGLLTHWGNGRSKAISPNPPFAKGGTGRIISGIRVGAYPPTENSLPTLTLDLPLMGLVYLLIPLAWCTGFASGNGLRGWLSLPLIAIVGNILGAIHAAYLAVPRGFDRLLLYLACLLWLLIASIPIGIHQPEIVIMGIIVALGSAWLRSQLAERRLNRGDDRRFEWLTLRQILPLFAAFIILSSLWPFDFSALKWQGMTALLPADVIAEKIHVFLALEHVIAFLLLGYILAELQGRNIDDFRHLAFRAMACSGAISLLIEAFRGMIPRQGASLLLFGFSVAASVFGVWLYQLQRDHIRALLSRN